MTWRDYDMIESQLKAKMRLWTQPLRTNWGRRTFGWEGHMVLKGNKRVIVAKRV